MDNNPHARWDMKTIQMTIDESLLEEVDKVTQDLKTTRSAFIRSALQLALQQHAIAKLERQHAEGYAKHPITSGEFDVCESEQAWGQQ
jgi:metal-responsive CopG/Arc/MetJ family transcriptional regulator